MPFWKPEPGGEELEAQEASGHLQAQPILQPLWLPTGALHETGSQDTEEPGAFRSVVQPALSNLLRDLTRKALEKRSVALQRQEVGGKPKGSYGK